MAKKEYGVDLVKLEDVHDVDYVIVAVAHDEFKKPGLEKIKGLYRECADTEKVLIDVKGIHRIEDMRESKIQWWRLWFCCILNSYSHSIFGG